MFRKPFKKLTCVRVFALRGKVANVYDQHRYRSRVNTNQPRMYTSKKIMDFITKDMWIGLR